MSNLPPGVTDAMVDAAYGDHYEECESWEDGDCTCDEIADAAEDDRAIEDYESSRDYDVEWSDRWP